MNHGIAQDLNSGSSPKQRIEGTEAIVCPLKRKDYALFVARFGSIANLSSMFFSQDNKSRIAWGHFQRTYIFLRLVVISMFDTVHCGY